MQPASPASSPLPYTSDPITCDDSNPNRILVAKSKPKSKTTYHAHDHGRDYNQNNFHNNPNLNLAQGDTIPSITPNYNHTNPNLIPITSIRNRISNHSHNQTPTPNHNQTPNRNTTPPSSPTASSSASFFSSHHHHPHPYPPALHSLISRTSRAYDLILSYPRDALGGQRWYTADIAHIREVGAHLHDDVRALRRLTQRYRAHGENAEGNDEHTSLRHTIGHKADALGRYCEAIMHAMREVENFTTQQVWATGLYGWDGEALYRLSAAEVRHSAKMQIPHDTTACEEKRRDADARPRSRSPEREEGRRVRLPFRDRRG